MKAKLLPIRFKEANERENKEFEQQLNIIKSTYGYEAEFLEPFFWVTAIFRHQTLLFFRN